MSHNIELIDPITRQTILLDTPHQMRGGTFVLGGTREAWLNVTYNYAAILTRVLGSGGIRTIYGKTGAESVSMLNEAISKLDDNTDNDYWKPTEGNVKSVLLQLKTLAQLRPDGVWSGD